MSHNHIIPLTFVVFVVVASPSFAVEVRTYQFSGDNRPFAYHAWGPAIDAQLSGTFDLVLDQLAGTAQLTNLHARIVNPAHAQPNQDIPLITSERTYFDNIPLTTRWPTNLTSLQGHFLAPDLLEFDGPNDGIFLRQDAGHNFPYLGYSFASIHNVDAYDTALQLKLGSDTATLTGVATQILWNDSALYYLLGAQVTLVPEPSSGTLVAITIVFASGLILRRRATPHNRV